MELYDQNYFGNGDFHFIKDTLVKKFLKSAHTSITLCNLWDWIRFYEPSPNTSFIWSKTHEMYTLKLHMRKDTINYYHSRYSYDFIMREMEFIAKYGYYLFKLTTFY